MKRFFNLSLLAAMLLPVTSRAADSLYDNTGNVGPIGPVINATNFLNHGTFNIFTSQPFETFDTLNYTNYGTMIGESGWRFEHTPTYTANRRMANSFVNYNPGTIVANDPIASFQGLPCFRALVDPSYLFIGATNITTGAGFPANGASLTVGADGWMQLVGEKVDVSNSGLQVLPVWLNPNGSFFRSVDRTNYQSDVAVSDVYWEAGEYTEDLPLATGGLWNGNIARALGGTNTPGFSIIPTAADSYVIFDRLTLTLTNFTGPPDDVDEIVPFDVIIPTNMFKHAVFAAARPQFFTEVGFDGTQQANNPFRAAAVLFSTTISNAVTGLDDEAYINGFDTLAADSRYRGLSENIIGCEAQTFKPMNFNFSRLSGLDGGPGGNGVPPANFFTSTGVGLTYPTNIMRDTVTNTVVTSGNYANYASFFDNILIRPPAVSGGNETNYPGRVRIYADALNMENTRIRGEGQIYLQSDHLISTKDAVVDSENISFSFSSTNGVLKIDNIAPDEVQRLRGLVRAWSVVWTNTVVVMFTNYTFTNVAIPFPPNSTNFITNIVAIFTPTTNEVTVGFSATMIGGDGLDTFFPVNVYEAGATARDVVIEDNLTVARTFKVTSRSLTLNGDLTFPGFYPPDPVTGNSPPDPVLEDWTTALAPNLAYFTNNGNLSIANRAIFGTDRVSPYAAFINHAGISAAGFRLRSDYFENSGSILSQSDLEMKGRIGKLEGGDSTSSSITRFEVNKLKFNNYQILSDGPLVLSVSDDLSDAGDGSANLFRLSDGFLMASKPKKGDLLGTTFSLEAPANAISVFINNSWAAEDRGASAAGYVDNSAIGQLLLSAPNHPLAKFAFNAPLGAGPRALYVDLLDLTELGTNYASQLIIQPNMVIYFAAAKLGFTPPPNSNNIPVLPEELLDGKFSGRLRWVKTFAGPNSSTPVVINGQTHIVNSALFNSHIIDSDGDGVPNFDDGVLPANGDKFNAAPITVTVNGNGSLAPNHNGQSLIIGLTYSMVALPADGASFTGWTGSIPSASPTLTFVMQSNLNLTANFSYAAVAGTYRGLFYEPSGVQFLKSGAFQAATTAKRGISGSLQIGKNKHSFKGTLSTEGAATILIPRSGNTPLTLNVLAGFEQITGTVDDGTWTANLVADRAVYSKANPTSLAGKYTLNIPGNGNEADTTTPHGDGFGAVTLSTAGGVSLKGSLADGSKISQSSAISQTGQWPLYTSLYAGGGQLLGWMTFANSGGADIEGPLSWFKKPNPVASFYPAGFDVEPDGIGSRYDSTLSPAIGFVDGFFTFTGGNLTTDFMNDVAFAAGNKVVNLSPNKLTFKLKTDGTFSGSAVNPSTGRSLKYSGALLQKQGVGGGYFLGTDQSGKVLVAP